MPSQGVKLYVQDKHVLTLCFPLFISFFVLTTFFGFYHLQVVLDNGILQVTISNPDGILTAIQYNGIDNLLAVENQEADRG